jgi:hypothetical protein
MSPNWMLGQPHGVARLRHDSSAAHDRGRDQAPTRTQHKQKEHTVDLSHRISKAGDPLAELIPEDRLLFQIETPGNRTKNDQLHKDHA